MTKDLSYEQRIFIINRGIFYFDGVFTDNFVYFSEDGLETIKFQEATAGYCATS